MKKTMTFLAAGLVLFAACKKSHDAPNSERILGRWTLVSQVENSSYLGQTSNNTYTGVPGEFAEFRSNGVVVSYAQGYYDSTNYKLVGDSKLVVNGDTSNITTLTDNSLIFSEKYTDPNGYDEYITSLKK